MLDLPDYLKPLQFLTQPYPRDAVDAVLARREEAIPQLLQVLERVPELCANDEWDPDWMIHEYALYLLAEFQEPRAFPLIIKMARLPELDLLLGDGITEALPKALAATFSGELRDFYPLVEDRQADEFARGGALVAMGILCVQDRVTRPQLELCLMELYSLIEAEPMHVWDAWSGLAADFGDDILFDKVRSLYQRGLADPGFQTLSELEAAFNYSELSPEARDEYQRFSSVHECMSWWHCFSEDYTQECRESDAQGEHDAGLIARDAGYLRSSSFGVQEPHVRESPKVGRNDPCLCGSGKKYKKCCL